MQQHLYLHLLCFIVKHCNYIKLDLPLVCSEIPPFLVLVYLFNVAASHFLVLYLRQILLMYLLPAGHAFPYQTRVDLYQ